jgi:hypothetical protein
MENTNNKPKKLGRAFTYNTEMVQINIYVPKVLVAHIKKIIEQLLEPYKVK